MQAATMFFGQMLAFIAFFIMKKRNPQDFKMRQLQAQSQGKIMKINKLLLAVPAVCDAISSTLHYIALNFISGSIYLMLRGGTIVTTLLFSVIFLKFKVKAHHYIGSSLALFGVIIVGCSNLFFGGGSQTGGSTTQQIIGYGLVILSLFFNGFFFIYEQKLLHKYHLQPLQVVGYQGIFGLILYACIILIISFVPCNFGINACVFGQNGMSTLQNPISYFRQASSSWNLLLFVILGVFSIATFNISGVTVTKHINALARSIAEVTRTIVVWTVGIIVTLSFGSKYPNYIWQIINGGSIAIQLIGFIILILGNLIYNQMVKLPFIKYQQDSQQTKQAQKSLLSSQSNSNNKQ